MRRYEDEYTNTEADAGAFEDHMWGDLAYDPDEKPTRQEIAAEEADDNNGRKFKR